MSHKQCGEQMWVKNNHFSNYCSRYTAHKVSRLMQHSPGDGYSADTLILLSTHNSLHLNELPRGAGRVELKLKELLKKERNSQQSLIQSLISRLYSEDQ